MKEPLTCAFCGRSGLPSYVELLGSKSCLGCLGEFHALETYGVEGEAEQEFKRRRSEGSRTR